MYCVKCGKKGLSGEKRCAGCGTRLVTAAKLERLLKYEKQLKRKTEWQKALENLKAYWLGFTQRIKPGLQRIQKALEEMGEKLDGARKEFMPRFTRWLTRVRKKLRKTRMRLKKRVDQWLKQRREAAEAAKAEPRSRAPEPRRRVSQSDARYRTEREVLWQSDVPRRRASGSPAPRRSDTARRPAARPVNRAAQRNGRAAEMRSAGNRRGKRFLQKHLRSLVAFGALAVALLLFILWGACSEGGMKTFASLGLGKAQGYMLLGDDCMTSGNYSRAVENYREALARDNSYESALKLAIAYSYTGDITTEAGVLLWCTQYYPSEKQPYQQLLVLYNNYASVHTDKVRNAIEQGFLRFGSLG